MSVIDHREPYDGIAVFCGDGAYSIDFVYYLREQFQKKKTDLLPMPGSSRAFSLYEQDGHKLPAENIERLNKMKEALEIALAIYLVHGGDEIHICDHSKCDFWFDYKDDQEARLAQIASMYGAASAILNFIKRLINDASFANKMKVDDIGKIKVKKFVLHYAMVNNKGDLEKIEKVGELPITLFEKQKSSHFLFMHLNHNILFLFDIKALFW